MDDPLQRYRQKRDFSRTREPAGQRTRSAATLGFVVQKHAARQLHYDFRLELDGTLKSWAIPKGPSLDPADKRMAVHVEDHPLDYAGFEGVIPAGQYGAGSVIVWDRGQWLPEGDPHAGYRAGKLKFELRGEKLRGRWTLVRMRGRGEQRQEPWLLIKEHDDAARPAAGYSVVEALPDSVLAAPARHPTPAAKSGRKAQREPTRAAAAGPSARAAAPRRRAAPGQHRPLPEGAVKAALPLALAPQLATLVDRVPADGDWRYELKFDGYRLLARINGGEVRLYTRNGHDWSAKLKALVKEVKTLALPSGWLDGEIVVRDAHGAPDFQLLQNAFESARTGVIEYFVFDLPWFDGHDLRAVALAQRRALLRALLEAQPSDQLRYSEDFAVEPRSLLHTACAMRIEGVIGKRADAPYVSRRAPTWIKLKCSQRQEFVIGGYTDPKGSRAGLGSLLLGVHDDAGALRYAGNVGTGFDQRGLRELADRLAALRTEHAPFEGLPRSVRGHWVRPKLVAEVSFAEWTRDGRVRQAVFHGLRSDKPPRAIGRERPVAPAPAPPSAPRGRSGGWPSALKLTHAERVIDASTGITKGELAQYYARIARQMLPHLQRRPVALLRGPAGIDGELFFQKHGAALKVPGIRQLDPSLDPGHEPLLEIPNAKALLGCVQMNVIEFHTWNATTRSIEKPDRMTFDLDPGEGLAWPRMVEAAELLRALLQELELTSFLKTSGGKGLHVIVPITPALGWDAVKAVSQAIVAHLARTLPERFVAKSGPRNRVGKVFVDYLRNGRGATTAAAWSARARPGLGVSVPLAWDELAALRSAAQWTVRNIDERLARPDPWAAYRGTRQGLRCAIKALDLVLPR